MKKTLSSILLLSLLFLGACSSNGLNVSVSKSDDAGKEYMTVSGDASKGSKVSYKVGKDKYKDTQVDMYGREHKIVSDKDGKFKFNQIKTAKKSDLKVKADVDGKSQEQTVSIEDGKSLIGFDKLKKSLSASGEGKEMAEKMPKKSQSFIKREGGNFFGMDVSNGDVMRIYGSYSTKLNGTSEKDAKDQAAANILIHLISLEKPISISDDDVVKVSNVIVSDKFENEKKDINIGKVNLKVQNTKDKDKYVTSYAITEK